VSIDHLDGGAPEIYRKLAQLGTQARLKVLERRYQEQIKALKATIDTRKITVSVIQANQGKINAMHSYHSLGRVLRDAGFTFPPLIESIPEGGASTSAPSACRSWMPISSSPPGAGIRAVNRRTSWRRWMR
jgi:iron complex transport system substrate-binding protein